MALDAFNPYLFVSAGEQSNKFLTPTYSGGIAQFQAQRAQQVTKLLVQIDPVQDLNGQANPYPPGGGKNRLENTYTTQTVSGVNLTVNEDGTIVANGTASETITAVLNSAISLSQGRYILSGCPTGGGASEHYKIDIVRNGESTRKVDTGSGTTFDVDTDGLYTARVVIYSGEVCNNLTFKPMVRLSSVTDSTFAPYSNICPISGWEGMTVTVQSGETENEYSISWQTEAGTVYGGTLDVVSGVLTVNSFLLTLSDTITPTITVNDYEYATNPSRWQIPVGGSSYSEYRLDGNRLGESICDGLRYNSGSFSTLAEGDFRFSGVQSGGYRLLQFCPSGMPTTLEALTAELVARPLHFVLPLETPQTYQLDPEQIMTLPGFNQIYSDAGPVIDIEF